MGRRRKVDVDIDQNSSVRQNNRADIDNDVDNVDFGDLSVTVVQDTDANVDQDVGVSINIS
jgi:hypothetical protein